jgi:hypothetical protein
MGLLLDVAENPPARLCIAVSRMEMPVLERVMERLLGDV